MNDDPSPSDYPQNTAPDRPRTVKEMDPDEQPREKAEKYGCGVLSVPELWALIIRVGAQGIPVTTLCRDLMRDNEGSLHRLERRTRAQLRAIRGIGPTKSIQVEAVLELIRRYCTEEIPPAVRITSSGTIFDIMRNRIGNLDHEEVWIILLNRRNNVIKEICLTSGTSVASLFDLKKALKYAITENAEGLIMVHNHPSGGTVPSTQDDNITRSMKKGCEYLDIRMLDHVIVTSNDYYSYRDSGRL